MNDDYLQRLAANLVEAATAASMGTADEGAAFIRSLLPGYADYNSELAAIRGGMTAHRENFPGQAFASSLIGGIAASATPAAVETAPMALTGILKNSAVNTGMGGISGFAEGAGGFEERLSSAGTSALLSGLLSAGIGTAAHKMRNPNLGGLLADETGAIKLSQKAEETITAEDVARAIRQSGYPSRTDFGLRALWANEELGELKPSFMIDGTGADRIVGQLSGTSTINLGKYDPTNSIEDLVEEIAADLPKALKRVEGYRRGRLGLVAGLRDIGEAQEDMGEAVLRDAELLKTWGENSANSQREYEIFSELIKQYLSGGE